MKRMLVFLMSMLMALSHSYGQSRTITGRVIDEKGAPVPNASVRVKDSNVGTTATIEGLFSLVLPSTARALVFSSVGLAEQEVAITSSTIYNVTLGTSATALQEVIVVGYGTGKAVGNQVGSITTVSAERIQDRPTANAFDALQGKVAGLQVFTSSGEPSQLSSLRLHGVGSLGASSTPLYVMDGIPIDPGTVISLNPNDFESISVLKDASATSIYGARAANGVIYITTKKGSANRPATITFQNQYAVSNLANTEFFERFMNSRQLGDFFVASGYRRQGQIDTTLMTYPNDTKWVDHFYRSDAPMYQTDLSISGGAGKSSYYISGGYLNQEGLAYRSGFKRYTLRSNLTTQVNNWFRIGLNLFGGYDERETNPYGSNSLGRGLGLLAPPWFSPIDPATGEQYYGQIPGWGSNSPRYLEDKIYSRSNNAQFNPSGYVQITPIKNLTFKTQAGLEAYDFRTTSGTLPSYNNTFSGSSNESYSRGISRTITNTGEYRFDIASDHSFAVLLGNEYIANVTTGFNAGSTGQSDDRLILLGQGTAGFTAGSSKSEYSFLSYFSRFDYDYNNKYYLDVSFRQDQSSRFGVDNRTANFYAVGVMWKASQEEFFSRFNWLSDLNFKASYGTSGNSSIGNYESQALVGTTNYAGASGWGISSPGNPELGWENQSKLTIGTNFELFKRVRANVEYYNRVTENMLISVPFPYTSGFSSITTNVGSLRNSGFDINIDADVLSSKNAYITPYFTFNYNKNEVTELFQGKDYWMIPNTGVLWAVGQPVSYAYPLFAQVNPQTGDPEWYVPSAKIMDITKNPASVTNVFNAAALVQNTGIRRNNPVTGGFGTTAGYKGFFMSADFSFALGKYMINNDRYFFENPRVFPGYNQYNSVNDFWKQPGDIARFPRVGVTNWTQFDSRLIENASFARMKAITFGYKLPASILSKTGFVKAVNYYITGRNLLTWTKYTGPDPEVDSNIGLGTNPNTKQVAIGLDITF